MKSLVITLALMLNLFFCISLVAFDNFNEGPVVNNFVDSSGQIDSTAIRLIRILEGDYFHVKTREGKLFLGKVHLSKNGIFISYPEKGHLSTTVWQKKEIYWNALDFIQHRNIEKDTDLSIVGALGAAVLTCILLLI